MKSRHFSWGAILPLLIAGWMITPPISAQLLRPRNTDNRAAQPQPANAPTLAPINAPAVAQQQPIPPNSPPAATSGTKSSDGSEFNLPANANPAQLWDFAETLMNQEREFETQDEYKAWMARMIQTVFLIANKILESQINDELYAKATNLKGEMIYFHGMNNPDTFAVYEQFARGNFQDQRLMKTPEGKNVADNHLAGFLHWGCTRLVQQKGSVEDLKKHIGEFQTLVLRNPEFVSMIPELTYPITEYVTDQKNPQLLKELVGPLSTALKGSSNADLVEAASGLEGLMRFVDLKGKPFEIVGTRADGGKFDTATLKGKIVLVNFWGAQVPSCVAQYPDLLALYVEHKEKGFEIVGYSIDDDPAKLNEFLTTKKVSWTNLSEALSRKNQQPSLTDFYGITGVPTFLLIGADGKVLESDLDMEQLQQKLAELF